MPALPLDEAGKYVAAAYVVFVVLIGIYVAIMAAKLQRIERDLRELAGFAEQRQNTSEDASNSSLPKTEIERRAGGDRAAPGRGSEGQSISVSSGPSESGGGGA